MSPEFSGASGDREPLRRLSVALFTLLAVRMIFHAFYVPAYEGPDEPFHLARAAMFADETPARALQGREVSGVIVASIAAHPCSPDLRRSFGCPPFEHSGAFNLLSRTGAASPAGGYPNYEAHQPPLVYLVVGVLFRMLPKSPEGRLLFFRLLSVAAILLAVAVPLRRLVGSESRFAVAGLLLGLLPGAAEALARGSNDAAVFAWAALVLERTFHRGRSWEIVGLLAIGPLMKLTAFPIVAVVVVFLWLATRRGTAVFGAIASFLVFAAQAGRGWLWGGSLELNTGKLPGGETAAMWANGLARSAYTFVKTVFWLGEWSFFRAPLILVVGWFGLVAALAVLVARSWRRRGAPLPDLAGLTSAVSACLVFAVLHRGVFGQWGGLGGYYAWSWAPWLFLASRPVLSPLRGRGLVLLGAFVVAANLCWVQKALSLYGI
ncbi:MAG: DUF2142 domain-containing protein [Acidobacteriota bacterium]